MVRDLLVVLQHEDGDWIVDVWQVDDDYEAWLQHKDYGIKMFMFGEPVEQQCLECFLNAVGNTLDEAIEIYENDYMD